MLSFCLPYYYGLLNDSKTAFVSPIAQVFLVGVSLEGCNGEFNGKWTKKQKIPKNAFSDGPSVNQRTF